MSSGDTTAARLRGLHVLADDDPRWPRDPVEQARAACAGGASVVQLRAKRSGDAQALDWAEEIRVLTRESGRLFVVNDRFDLALASGADGVHLGQEDLPPERMPLSARAALLVGRSTHTPEQLGRAAGEEIDYVAFGPVFGTASKESPYDARGLEALAEAVRRVAPIPAVAIGGIEASRAARVAATGAGVAVISAVAGAPDAEAATAALVSAMREGRG